MNTKEMAQTLGITEQATTQAVRRGKFGRFAWRDRRGAWVFDDSAAAEFWRSTDPTRHTAERQAAIPARGRAPAKDALDLAVEQDMAERSLWLLEAAKLTPGLDAFDLADLEGIFLRYIETECPTALPAWKAGRITPNKDPFP